MTDEIINRVEGSGLIQVNLDDFYPMGERVNFDVANYLKEGLVLIEKEFRQKLAEIDWSNYIDKYVAINCLSDAIVPLWAYMLVDSYLKPHVKKCVLGDFQDLEKEIFTDVIQQHDFNQYNDKSVIVKGCGTHPIPEAVFVSFTNKLHHHAKTIMFGEACSAVPLYKRTKK